MTIKNRLQKLERKQKTEVKAGEVFTVRRIDYRAGIVPGVDDPPGALIAVRLVTPKQEDAKHEHKDQDVTDGNSAND